MMASDECFPFCQPPRYSQNFTYEKEFEGSIFPILTQSTQKTIGKPTGNELSNPTSALNIESKGGKRIVSCVGVASMKRENEIFPTESHAVPDGRESSQTHAPLALSIPLRCPDSIARRTRQIFFLHRKFFHPQKSCLTIWYHRRKAETIFFSVHGWMRGAEKDYGKSSRWEGGWHTVSVVVWMEGKSQLSAELSMTFTSTPPLKMKNYRLTSAPHTDKQFDYLLLPAAHSGTICAALSCPASVACRDWDSESSGRSWARACRACSTAWWTCTCCPSRRDTPCTRTTADPRAALESDNEKQLASVD